MSDLEAQLDSADERFMSGDVQGGLGQITDLATAGYTPSQVILGWVYRVGAGGVTVDRAAALHWWSMAAKQGDPVGMAYLGLTVLKEEPEESLRWLVASGDAGYPPAFYELGRIYHHGKVVEEDFARATSCMRRAAGLGHPHAKAWIARMGVTGRYGLSGVFRGISHFVTSPWQAAKQTGNPPWLVNLDHLRWPGPCEPSVKLLAKPPRARPAGLRNQWAGPAGPDRS